MAKTQVIYNQIGLYVGAASLGASGYNFISSDGVINNDSSVTTDNFPLVFPLKRINSCSYSIEANRTNISHLGDFGTISRPTLNDAQVSFSFNYYLMGLINELRIGLLCNTNYDHIETGPLIYGTGRASLLSGLYSRDYTPSQDTQVNYPLKSREPRNLFVACRKDALDLNDSASGDFFKNTEINVFGFGNTYLTSYSSSAGVNQLPEVSVSFVCHNIEVYSSGLDNNIPAINPRTYNVYSGVKFSIPDTFDGTGLPTVMIPSDITLSIRQKSNNSENLTDLFLDYTDVKIQSYDFDINLNRNPLYKIGYKYPVDRVLAAPIVSNLNFSLFPGDAKAGSLVSLMKRDENYDVFIRLNYQRGSLFNGCGVCYEFINAKFNGFDSEISTSQKESNTLSFTTEIDPLRTDRGIFMTGFIGIPGENLISTTLSDEFDGGGIDELLFEDGDIFAISLSGRKLLY